MDVEQYHFLQRDVVSSLHERLKKEEKIVCDLFDTLTSGFFRRLH